MGVMTQFVMIRWSYRWAMQIKVGETFDLPEGHIDYGKEVTGYYFWIFPNFMLNFYPWGVQLNIVKPYSPDFCRVEFIYYIYNQEVNG